MNIDKTTQHYQEVFAQVKEMEIEALDDSLGFLVDEDNEDNDIAILIQNIKSTKDFDELTNAMIVGGVWDNHDADFQTQRFESIFEDDDNDLIEF